MGKEVLDVKEYGYNLYRTALSLFNNPNSIYYGKEGHIRFAKETAVAKFDFTEAQWCDFVKGSYSTIYVRGCNLKPILDAKQWNRILLYGIYGHVIKMGTLIEYKSIMGKRATFLYCGKIKGSQGKEMYLLYRLCNYGNIPGFVTVERCWIEMNKNRIVLREPGNTSRGVAKLKKERYRKIKGQKNACFSGM